MAQSLLTPENQIQRLNTLFSYVDSLKELPREALVARPHEKAWHVLEVLEHLSISYSLYQEKIAQALSEAPTSKERIWAYRPGFWNRLVIAGQRPKGTKRPFKMKTLKKFEPLISENPSKKAVLDVFERFYRSYGELKEAILQSRHKKMEHGRISSAIGPVVKFHLPEAFEFLICHAERHKIQIEETLTACEELGKPPMTTTE